jgi:hypothetical protein
LSTGLGDADEAELAVIRARRVEVDRADPQQAFAERLLRIDVLHAVDARLSNFFFIPYYPIWALVVIALDVWVIWALTRPGAIET